MSYHPFQIEPQPHAIHREIMQWRSHWGWQGGQSATPDRKKLSKIGKNREKNEEKSGKNQEKSGKKRKNLEFSFTLPLLTVRAGYATEIMPLRITVAYDTLCHGGICQSGESRMSRPLYTVTNEISTTLCQMIWSSTMPGNVSFVTLLHIEGTCSAGPFAMLSRP